MHSETLNRYPKLAVFLAAGLGRRLAPNTLRTPKSLLKFGGSPILNYILHALLNTRIRHVVVVTHHLEDQIRSYLTEWFADRLDIRFCHQAVLDGTAGALNCAADVIKRENADPFLVSAADYHMPPGYLKALIQYHCNGHHDVSIGLRNVSAAQACRSNLTTVGDGDKIAAIAEKPSCLAGAGPFLAAYLIYIVPLRILDYSSGLHRTERGEIELPDAINGMIQDKIDVRGCRGDAFLEWERQYVNGQTKRI
jgi:NDP-sugar pyrophosphorylase family protein